jgi:hypothetical protein
VEYRELLLNIAKEFSKLLSIFTKVEEIQTILNNLRWHLTVFPSDFNNIYLKYFGILQNLTRNYEILQKFMKVYKSYDIPRYFFGQITCFRSVLFAWYVLFAFRNFVRWRMKFSCLLSFRIASRQYRPIFRQRQMIGDISNIADTYIIIVFQNEKVKNATNYEPTAKNSRWQRLFRINRQEFLSPGTICTI